VVDALAGRIRDSSLPPGEKLPTEVAIMQELGVSCTVPVSPAWRRRRRQ
jgi:DNA-binding FadR family transcriptional regulator